MNKIYIDIEKRKKREREAKYDNNRSD